MRIFTKAFENISHESDCYVFLTCLRYIFHSSVVPEILSNEKLVKQLATLQEDNNSKINSLFVLSHTMQFTPLLCFNDTTNTQCRQILRQLTNSMRYFTRTLQTLKLDTSDTVDEETLDLVSNIRSLTELHLESVKITALSKLANFSCALRILHLSVRSGSLRANNDETVLQETLKSVSEQPLNFGLRELVLDRCREPALFIKVFCQRKTLRSLEIHEGYFTFREIDLLAEVAPNLTRLLITTTFNLQENQLAHLSRGFPHLQELGFGKNCTSSCVHDFSFLNNSSLANTLTRLELNHLITARSTTTTSFDTNTTNNVMAPLGQLKNIRSFTFISSSGANGLIFDDAALAVFKDWTMLRSLILDCSDQQELLSCEKLGQLSETFWGSIESCTLVGKIAFGQSDSLFRCMKSVRSLTLHFEQFQSDEDLQSIHYLNGTLRHLDLCASRFCKKSGALTKHLGGLTNLETLQLDRFPKLGNLQFLRNLFNLRQLNLMHCQDLRSSSFKVVVPSQQKRTKSTKITCSPLPLLSVLGLPGSVTGVNELAEVLELICQNDNLKHGLKTINLNLDRGFGGDTSFSLSLPDQLQGDEDKAYRSFLEKEVDEFYRKKYTRREYKEWLWIQSCHHETFEEDYSTPEKKAEWCRKRRESFESTKQLNRTAVARIIECCKKLPNLDATMSLKRVRGGFEAEWCSHSKREDDNDADLAAFLQQYNE